MKKLFLKLNLFLLKKLGGNKFKEISPEERQITIITNILLNDPKSETLLHPSRSKVYIKNKEREIFVVIDIMKSEFMIVNHKYGYTLTLGQRTLDNIYDKFIGVTETKRLQMEREYTTNIRNSLVSIVENIKSK